MALYSLRKVDISSVFKTVGAMMLVIGIAIYVIAVFILGIITIITGEWISMITAILMGLIGLVLYVVFYSLICSLLAWIYNLVTTKTQIGGIKVDLELEVEKEKKETLIN
ncbi:MAG: hypothetical protein LBV16_02160 [Elusimicrobiota bacterium]|jgi:hypothetical protein|nr:hypothetical protein [Elusimicrobiota bacterium]